MLSATDPQTRCCPAHTSFTQLNEHLAAEFSDLDVRVVARELARALAAAHFTGLASDDDRLLMCELVARQQLQLLSGRRFDAARLDPEKHAARSGMAWAEDGA